MALRRRVVERADALQPDKGEGDDEFSHRGGIGPRLPAKADATPGHGGGIQRIDAGAELGNYLELGQGIDDLGSHMFKRDHGDIGAGQECNQLRTRQNP